MKNESEPFRLTEASDLFNEAIARGGRAIRRREAARRRRGRMLAAAAAVVILIVGGALALHRLAGLRPQDRRTAALSQGTAGTEPSPTPPVSPTPSPLPAEEAPYVTPTADPGPTPAPTPVPASGMAVADGQLLYGGEGHKLSGEPQLYPRTPALSHHAYARGDALLTPDAAAEALWKGAPFSREDYDGIVVYTVQAKDNPYGAYKAKLYWHEDEQRFSYSPDDPARLSPELLSGEDEPLDGLLKAGEWFMGWMDPEVMASLIPFSAGEGYREGDAVGRYADFCWLQPLEEGVGVYDAGLRGTYCSYGPYFFVLGLYDFVPADDDRTAAPAYLTSRQALDALNDAARRCAGDGEDPRVFTDPQAPVTAIQPVFTDRFSQETDGLYRFAWALILAHPDRPGDTLTVLVDGATGAVWNDHDGIVPTVYTPQQATTTVAMAGNGTILSVLSHPVRLPREPAALRYSGPVE